MKIKMLKTKTLNKTVTTILILLLTISMLTVINFIIIIPTVQAVDYETTGDIYVRANKTVATLAEANGSIAKPYHNITQALDKCTGNAVIHVYSGTYNKTIETFPLTIADDNVTLVSTDGAATTFINSTEWTGIGPGDNNITVRISGTHNDTIEGFTIIGNVTLGFNYGIGTSGNPGDATIRNNVIKGTREIGIAGSFSTGLLIEGNTFTSNNFHGIYLTSAPEGVVRNNTITGGGIQGSWAVGIVLGAGNCSYLTITNNTIESNTWAGIYNELTGWIQGTNITNNDILGNTAYGIRNDNTTYVVNATLNWWGDNTGPSGVASGDGDAVSTYVDYDPWLGMYSKSITPTSVKGNVAQLFNVTVTNTGSNPAIGYINITYPSGWIYNNCTTPDHWCRATKDGNTLVFQADSGYYLTNKPTPQSVTLGLNMNATGDGNWTVSCKNDRTPPEEGYLPPPLEVQVDSQAPTVDIPALPTIYSVGAGNRIWINGTIWDDTDAKPSVAINDTTYFLQNPQVLEYNETASSTGHYVWYFRFWNTSAVPDDYLAVNVTGTDAAGNARLPSEAIEANATIDNTDPTLIDYELVVADDRGNLTRTDDTFYMSGDATELNFTVMFSELHSCTNVTYISNDTVTIRKTFNNNTWFYDGTGYNVTGINRVTILNITITDLAQPNNNTLVAGPYTIIRDQEGPHNCTYTVTEICGGLVIKNLNSTDNVQVQKYEVYVNSTSFLNVTVTQLANTTLDWVTGALNRSCVFDGTLVLNLTNYAGGHANLTIRAVDIGGNNGNWSTPHVYTIDEGQWYPIELYEGWNLVSPPLIPDDEDIDSVLSGILSGTAEAAYYYDASANAWFTWPTALPGYELTTIEDGNGYWLYMEAYDVLIIQGTEMPTGAVLPPVYNVYAGWNLIGFKSISEMNVSRYLTTIPEDLLGIAVMFGWNATTQSYYLILPGSLATNLRPGQGYWLYLTGDATIVPPLP